MPAKKIIVADTSVIVKWINRLDEKRLEQADKLLKSAETGAIHITTPIIAVYELGNALLHKTMDPALADTTMQALFVLPITIIPITSTIAEMTLRIAQQHGMTYYDAAFVALAKESKAILVTDNPKHQKKSHGVRVVALSEYTK